MHFVRDEVGIIHDYEYLELTQKDLELIQKEKQAKEGSQAKEMTDSLTMCKKGNFHMEKISCAQSYRVQLRPGWGHLADFTLAYHKAKNVEVCTYNKFCSPNAKEKEKKKKI